MRFVLLFLLVSCAYAAPPPVQTISIYESGNTAAISATNITTVSGTTLYSEMFSLDRTEVHSFDISVTTTAAMSAVIEVEVSPDEGDTWFPAEITSDHGVTITATFKRNVLLALGVDKIARFRFTKDTGTPTIPYEIKYLKFNKQ